MPITRRREPFAEVVRGTFTPTISVNGSRRLVIGMIMTSVQSGPNATQTSAIGVTPA